MKRTDIERSEVGSLGKRYIPWDALTIDEKIARWRSVQRVLEALTPRQRKREFDMRYWNTVDPSQLPKEAVRATKTSCGTAACAAGWCAADPQFHKEGYFAKPTFDHKQWKDEGSPKITNITLLSRYTKHGFNVDEEDFFGNFGADAIFLDPTRRPVEKVILEVRRYILSLETEKIRRELAAFDEEQGDDD